LKIQAFFLAIKMAFTMQGSIWWISCIWQCPHGQRHLAASTAVYKHFAALLWAAGLSMSALCRPLRLIFRGPSVWHVARLRGPLNNRATGVGLNSSDFRIERAFRPFAISLAHMMELLGESRVITFFYARRYRGFEHCVFCCLLRALANWAKKKKRGNNNSGRRRWQNGDRRENDRHGNFVSK